MPDLSVSITRCAQPGAPSPAYPAAGASTTVARTLAARRRAPAAPAPQTALPRGRPLLAGRAPARTGPWLRTACQARPVPGDLTRRPEWRPDACGPGRQASPPRQAGIRVGCLHPRQRRGRARGHRPGPPRARPCGLPLRQGRAARPPAAQLAAGPFLFPRSPGRPYRANATPGRRGPDLTRRAERSVRRRDPTDGPPPGTPTAPGRPPPPRTKPPEAPATRC